MALISGIQNNYLLRNMPTSIVLNLINNCKRFIKTRGSEVYKEGEYFDGRLNLLLVGEVQICKRFEIIATENCELIENSETNHLFAPRVDYSIRPVGNRKSGDFVEKDLIQLSGRRNDSAFVASESALVLSIDVNLLLAVDKTFNIINNLSEVIMYQQTTKHEAEQRIKKMDIAVNTQAIGSTETAMRAKIIFDPHKEDSFVRQHVHHLGNSEKSAKLGFNTLISRIPLSKDRGNIAANLKYRAELARTSNSPALNKTIQEEPDPSRQLHRSFQISKPTEKSITRPANSKEKERIRKMVIDSMDQDPLHKLIEGDGNPICSIS